MKPVNGSTEKNIRLKAERNVSFEEEILASFERGEWQLSAKGKLHVSR